MALLSRNAGRIYWAARYLERAEDLSRLVQSYGELIADLPSDDDSSSRWAPLLAVQGVPPEELSVEVSERSVVAALVSDVEEPGSVAACVVSARENLRTTREVLPREAWRTVNDLSLFARQEVPRAGDRRFRDRVLSRVIDDSRRLDGILTSSMTRDDAFEIWRLGRYIERADMTTRVVGVRAAALMAQSDERQYDEVHWMGVLRSLSALQMYQRAVRGPIEPTAVVTFLLFDRNFPRSVAFGLDEICNSLERLTRSEEVQAAVDEAIAGLTSIEATVGEGSALDESMEWVQTLLGRVHDAIAQRYLSIDGG